MINEREVALEALLESEESGFANAALKKRLDGLRSMDPRGKAFVSELVYGTIRWKILLDYIIGLSSKTPVEKMDEEILGILRMAVYQMRFMDKVPDRAAVDEAVNLAKKKGFDYLSGFVNGVLRGVGRQGELELPSKEKDPALYISVAYSYPMWLVESFIKSFGATRAEAICKAGQERPSMTLCVNTLKTDASALAGILKKEGMEILEETAASITVLKTGELAELDSFTQGLYHVMDKSSMKAVDILDPRPGDEVMDVCAAPGGKAFYAGVKMHGNGAIHAYDKDKEKVWQLGKSAKRLGLGLIVGEVHDAFSFNELMADKCDRVLVDAPCSGFGVAARKPDIKYSKTPGSVKELAEVQKRMLEASWRCVKVGGTLVYSVCTLTLEECEEVSSWFAESFPFERDYEEKIWPGSGWDGFYISKFIRKK
jgi:16S rRNA (cytosine967-C5)-methyltransferase